MSDSKLYKDDVGTVILADVKSDITSATKAALKVMKTNASAEVEWVGTVYSETLSEYIEDTGAKQSNPDFDGMDLTDTVCRRIHYVVIAGDLDVSGVYKMQGYLEMPAWVGRGETFSVLVTEHFS